MRLEDLAGRRIGRYEVIALLGQGGMAAVYRARDTVLQRDVALKVLYPQFLGDATLVERFRREAVIAARLDHPGIVPIYDIGETDGRRSLRCACSTVLRSPMCCACVSV